jgi:opacity protein-like surface antigen
MRRFGGGLLGILWLLVAPASAAAQTSLAPVTGQVTGHVGISQGRDDRGTALSLGASVAAIEKSGWGAELDFGYADNADGDRGGLDVQSYMVNVVGMWPQGRIRPFVVAGVGALHVRACATACAAPPAWTDWGLNGGGGVQYVLDNALALRGDVRYFTALGDHPDPQRPDGFSFWRVSVGATYSWDISR